MKKEIAFILIILLSGATAAVAETMPAPGSAKGFFLGPEEIPVLDASAENASSIGFGAFAAGGDAISIRVGLMAFSSPVNIVFAIYAPTLCFETINGVHICDFACGSYTQDCTMTDYVYEFRMPLTEGYIVDDPMGRGTTPCISSANKVRPTW